ncbi:MAG TPA: hypothetical protein VFC21_05810 [Bryobacteraceae bacterium]|nr:hypothetical protein [Bryobacteraceae bacterium]
MSSDRDAVSKALRIPLAQPGISASPYMGVSDLIKKWPAANARREVLLITSGIDPWSSPDPQNLYLQKAIWDAQKAGILVSSIYYQEAGHLGHSYWRATWGQNYLSELADETGGGLYCQDLTSPVSLAPFLKEFAVRLENLKHVESDLNPRVELAPPRNLSSNERERVAGKNSRYVADTGGKGVGSCCQQEEVFGLGKCMAPREAWY